MADPRFYTRAGPYPLGELAKMAGAALGPAADPKFTVSDVAGIETLEPGMIGYATRATSAAATAAKANVALILAAAEPQGGLTPHLLLAKDPQRAFAQLLEKFYPPQTQPQFDPAAGAIDPSARIGEDCRIGPGAVIGPNVEIGVGTVVEPGAVIGPGCRVGRWCRIGAGVSLRYALIGDRVLLHPNSSIGQDGFGFVMGAQGHFKIQQIGRVIIQDDVEIGALCSVDRGALGDTLIGQGSKLDNLIHIGHNCRIGRNVVIAGMCGFSGSVEIGDFVVMGGQVGVGDHLKIGAGAMIAGGSGVTRDVPAGATYAGYPARPIAQWRREVASLARMVKNRGAKT